MQKSRSDRGVTSLPYNSSNVIGWTKKTMRLMGESLVTFNSFSRRVNERRDGAGSLSISRIRVYPYEDGTKKGKVTNE